MDHLMRQILTEINPYYLCVTEFVRVVDLKLPSRVFYRLSPELKNNGMTPSNVPVRVQLMGQNPHVLAENAERAIQLGSKGIDLNFGCPSRVVNGNKGGAALLKTPDIIYDVIYAVRKVVPKSHEVSAKIRLGWDDNCGALEIASAVEQAGATRITVHGRTKKDGYKAEKIDWESIGLINKHLTIPVVANGEIWQKHDATLCANVTGCSDLMIGRGALALPNLGAVILNNESPYTWKQTLQLLWRYTELEIKGDKGLYFPNRIKQWLNYLKVTFPEAKGFLFDIRKLNRTDDIVKALECAIERQNAA